MKYGVRNFLNIAKEHVQADTTTLDGIERKLIAWYCFTYGTTPNDERLGEMTLEDLMVLFHMHRIRNNPDEANQELNPNDYEDWLKKEMGETYMSDEEMVADMEKEERNYQKKVKEVFSDKEKYPDKISTDFSQFTKE